MVIQCVIILQRIYKITKRLRTPNEVEKYFPGFIAFIDSIEQQIQGLKIREERRCIIQEKEKT
ncbi:MAG: hypothetical protein ABJB73_00615 [Candidatus Nitrosocosmicus sp.]